MRARGTPKGEQVKIFKVEAEGDTMYIKRETLAEAKARLAEICGDIPPSLLKWTEVPKLPKGEEFL